MRNRKIVKTEELHEIIRKCDSCSLSMIDLEGRPYVVPMNFGLKDNELYFHSDPKGLKIDILKQNPEVCVAFSTDHLLRWQNEKVACSYSMRYRSVLIRGKVEFVSGFDQKKEGMDIIMRQYTENEYRYSDPAINNICIFKVVIDTIEGRAFGY